MVFLCAISDAKGERPRGWDWVDVIKVSGKYVLGNICITSTFILENTCWCLAYQVKPYCEQIPWIC